MKSLKALVILLLIAGTAWFLHDAKRDRDEATKRATEAELQAGIDGARIVNQRFSTAAALQVYEMAANAVGQATFKGTFFTSTQVSKAPFTVAYTVDLQKLDGGAYHWDTNSKTLIIDIPDVAVGKPNIDWTKVVTRQTGRYISREAGLSLGRQVATSMTVKADSEAQKRENLNKARESARVEISKFARNALVTGGVIDAKVAVSFPWEPKTSPSLPWDRSRSIREVVGEQ